MFNLKSLFSKKPAFSYEFDGDAISDQIDTGTDLIWVRQFAAAHLLYDYNDEKRLIVAIPPETSLEIRILICRSYFAGLRRCEFEWWTSTRKENLSQI